MARNRGGGGRGGARTPAKPAPVSNPQSGARTDGGAGSAKQPIRPTTGGNYGDRKASIDQQSAAPMATAGPTGGPPSPVPAGGGAVPPGASAPPPTGGVFGPTERPNEPGDFGVGSPAQNPLAANPQAALRVMYTKFPHPAIRRLIDWSAAPERKPR